MRVFLALILAISINLASDEFEDEFKAQDSTFDPLSGYNKMMTGFNDFMYSNIFIPTAKGYAAIMPEPGRNAVSNFFDNLKFPIRFINNLLQFKIKGAWDETRRFVANTIIGFGGITDAATKYYNIPRHDEDFGQTLGAWGIGSGFHIVLPLLGPSNLRDSVGLVGDVFASPLYYVKPDGLAWGATGYRELNSLSQNPEEYEKLKAGSVSLYPMIRDAYEQNRAYKIKE